MESSAEELRHYLREVIREWGLMHSHPCVPGVTLAQGHALIELQTSGELTIAELASRLKLDHSSASRLATKLTTAKLVTNKTSTADARKRVLCLTNLGKSTVSKVNVESNRRAKLALEHLDSSEQELVVEGLKLYAKALNRARQQQGFKIRPIQKRDAPDVARIIRTVMPEFGASGPGYAINDPEVDFMHKAYNRKGHAYFVIENNGEVVGGGGIGPLNGGDSETCELRKMYLLPEARGFGLGEKLVKLCLEAAFSNGYRTCYLETTSRMIQAQQLYQKLGFSPLTGPLGNTGHCACDKWFTKDLCAQKSLEKAANL